ncbi:hypothetical protein NYE86_16970 [Actinacidiphila bryophytorum]|nr:hypothetical protein [Actinacidiphila bryophytorum]UWE10237.1 hypothetical protein NYE86_16970 [Actinacidiphila bryophytorum]
MTSKRWAPGASGERVRDRATVRVPSAGAGSGASKVTPVSRTVRSGPSADRAAATANSSQAAAGTRGATAAGSAPSAVTIPASRSASTTVALSVRTVREVSGWPVPAAAGRSSTQ